MDKMLLIDGDIFCYRVGFACNDEPEHVALMTVDSSISDIILAEPFDEPSYQVYLTGKGNFRNDIAVTVPYKGNRKDTAKPVHYEAIRQHMVDFWEAIVTEGEETDDAIAIRATELYPESVIVSIDKDFLQVPGWHYNFVKKDLFYVTEELGLLSFYKQILVGDRIDNIVGALGIGDKKSQKLLEGKTEQEMYDTCVEILGEGRVIENARLLWLRREPEQLWQPPELESE